MLLGFIDRQKRGLGEAEGKLAVFESSLNVADFGVLVVDRSGSTVFAKRKLFTVYS